jgi:hypothetical protein
MATKRSRAIISVFSLEAPSKKIVSAKITWHSMYNNSSGNIPVITRSGIATKHTRKSASDKFNTRKFVELRSFLLTITARMTAALPPTPTNEMSIIKTVYMISSSLGEFTEGLVVLFMADSFCRLATTY